MMGGFNPGESGAYQNILKFTRVVFGVAPSPYLLNATIAWHIEQLEITHKWQCIK